ncbi:hypothetical protein BH11PSE8_BH11PSE8_28280 [soil metagenome]
MSTTPSQPTPHEATESDDGVLDSIGKAIVDPVKSGAEDEEPKDDATLPVAPGG